MRLVAFYHVCQIGHWRDVTAEIFSAVESSGLSAALDRCIVGVLGTEKIELPPWAVFGRRSSYIYWHEYATLELLQEFCRAEADPETFILYLHSKGVIWANSEQRKHRDGWRRDMLDGVVYKWKRCLEMLRDNDTVGCWWVPREYVKETHLFGSDVLMDKKYYPGNFWWARSAWVKELPAVSAFPCENRFHAEGWVTDSEAGKFARVK